MEFDTTHLQVNVNTRGGSGKTGPIEVGWFLSEGTDAPIIYDAPERLKSATENRTHAKSASRCPAVINMESRYFVVNCPVDINIGFRRDDKGKPTLVNRSGTKSPIRAGKLGKMLHLTAESEWRFPNRPMLQLKLPYFFIADEPVYVTQLSCFAHYRKIPLPGTIFGGRFPIHVWPRPLMWAFEWHEPEKDLVLRRGDPLFYVQFEGEGPDRPIQMVKAEHTPELREYLSAIGGAVNYVNQTFSLFKAADEIRPSKLLTKKVVK